MNIAIVGATGNVGRKIIEVLEASKILIDNLYLLSSSKSSGTKLKFRKKEIEVEILEKFDFSKADICFFAAGKEISKKYASLASKKCLIIDNSSFFRMDPEVPLVVPQVNPEALKTIKKNIISNPNCSTAQLVIVLNPVHKLFKVKRIVVSTYQSVSGAGKASMDELIEQTKSSLDKKKIYPKNFTKQIAFNAIPHIDDFTENGYTKEETKMIQETKKILHEDINVTATCVRIPVLISHAESVNLEFEKDFTIEQIKDALEMAGGCKVIDGYKDGGYITPIEAAGKNETFISRIRRDDSKKNSLNLWIVSDNLLRGAALNAVEIAETYIKLNK